MKVAARSLWAHVTASDLTRFVAGKRCPARHVNRGEVLQLLGNLRQAIVASDQEVLFFIESKALMGRCVGYVDAHLLAPVTLGNSTRLWTRDQRLRPVADALKLAYGED